jgi:hypothetical protein
VCSYQYATSWVEEVQGQTIGLRILTDI